MLATKHFAVPGSKQFLLSYLLWSNEIRASENDFVFDAEVYGLVHVKFSESFSEILSQQQKREIFSIITNRFPFRISVENYIHTTIDSLEFLQST